MEKKVKRIALLSGGGDCPGLNAVIRTITKTAIRKYGWEVIGYVYGYRGLYLSLIHIFIGKFFLGNKCDCYEIAII